MVHAVLDRSAKGRSSMAQTALDLATISRPTELSPDGRRLRAERSRQLIVDALISLIRKSEILPSAERVSEEANVGLRTVFRHFEDMDSLYQEVGEYIESQIFPIIDQPYRSADWRGRVREMIERRAEVFEWIMPFKIQSNARLLQSAFLQEKHRCAVESDMTRMCEVIPSDVLKDETLCAALSAAISFDVWHRLRKDQHKTPEQAKQAMLRMAEALLSGA
jgi:AcrR family transcriptional regulator